MSDEFCPRQITFTIPGQPSVEVTATEHSGAIHFSIDVQDSAATTADLRALFFHVNPDKLAGLTISDGGPLLSQYRIANNGVLDLGRGANLHGAVKSGFDVGVEWGSQGKDGIDFAVDFMLSNTHHNLTLDDISHQLFGVRLDSVQGPGGRGDSAVKLVGLAPAAPDARDDSVTIFEDGQQDGLASKTPTGVVLDVLGNDTDADNELLTVTGFHDGPAHGQVSISADGRSVIYTPDLDYSGTDSFVYCISDGHGGQDSAVVNLTVTAVADNPTFTITAAQGDTINETILTVTATQNDADGSETISDLSWSVLGGLPDGATITALGPVDPGFGADHATQHFLVTTAAGQDWDFDIEYTAQSVESSNGDTQSATAVETIAIDFNSNSQTQIYAVQGQSIWGEGPAYTVNYSEFLGFEDSFASSFRLALGDLDLGSGYDVAGSVRAGFGFDIQFSAGSIDATIPVDVQIDTTYNKTTDTLQIDPSIALGNGVHFQTTGPQGYVNVDSLFSLRAQAFVEILTIDVYNDKFDLTYSQNLFRLGSALADLDVNQFNGALVATAAWPHIAVNGTQSGSGQSNPFFTVTADVDDVVFTFLTGASNAMDEFEDDPTDFEMLDLDIIGSLKLMQDFALQLDSQTVTLRLEDNSLVAMNWGSPLTIENASSHDANHDGVIDFTLEFAPAVTLTNTTALGVDLGAQLVLLKNADPLDPLVDAYYPFVESGRIDLYSDTFALGGIAAQSMTFGA